MKLLVLGNGFDLAHGMATRYSDFKDYLQVNQPDLKESFEKLYPEKNNLGKYLLWSDFEEMLAFPDLQYAEEVNDLVGVELMGEYWADNVITKWFKEWVLHIVYGSYSELDATHPFRKYLANDNVALSFNYTVTLREVYGVTDVLNIHGNAAIGNLADNERIIFGHKHIDGVTHPLVTATEKPVKEVLEAHRCWFEDIARRSGQIDEVVLMGLSYGDVDLPYFHNIRVCCPYSKWTLFYYSKQDRDKAVEFCELLGILDYSFKNSKP